MGQSSLASHALVREPNVVRLPADVPWEIASPLACGVQTGAGGILNVLQPRAAHSVVVFGAGTVGLGAVMAAKYAGCETIVVADPLQERLDIARELGATHTLDPRAEDTVEKIRNVTGGGADFSIEASGSTSAGPPALDCLGVRGTCLLLGVVPFGTRIDIDWISLVSGRHVLGSPFGGGAPSSTINKLLEIRADGGLPVEKIVRTYPFSEVQQAVEDMGIRSDDQAGPTVRLTPERGNMNVSHDQLFYGGAWHQPSAGAGIIEVVSPSTEDVIGSVPDPAEADVDAAVAAARQAFDDPQGWAPGRSHARAEAMERLADAHRDAGRRVRASW